MDADQQQVYDDNGKPLQTVYDDNGKPLQPHPDVQGDQTGFLSRAEDFGNQLLGFGKTLFETATGSPSAATSLAQGLAKPIKDIAPAVGAVLTQGPQALSRPDIANSAFTGGVELFGGNPDAIRSDIANKNIPALAGDILPPVALGFLTHFIGGGSAPETEIPKTIEPQPITPEVLSAETPIPQARPIQQLNAAPIRGALPAYGETSASPRFYAGPAGIADARMAYPYDISDQSLASKGGTFTSATEPGVQAPNDIGPIEAANRSILQVNDPAQLNPAFRALVPNRYGPQVVPFSQQGIPKDIPDVMQQYRSGGEVINPPEKAPPFNSNRIDVVNRVLSQHEPEGLARTIDSNPQTVGQRPNPDVVNSTPVNPVIPEDLTMPRPGQARPTDTPNNIFTYIDDTNKILSRYNSTSGIARLLNNAQDSKLPWITDQLNKFDQYLGNNDTQNQQIFNILDGKLNPSTVDSDTLARAQGIRGILDDIHASLPRGIGPGKLGDVGYLNDYITHMKDADPANQSIWSYFFKKAQPETNLEQPNLTNPNAVGEGNSPYVEKRTGKLKDYSTDLPMVLRAYTSSIAKAKFDAPAVEAAKEIMNKIPETQPRLASLANAYIKNYNQYDGEGQLMNEMRGWTNAVANTTAQSVLAFNPVFHMLHVGEIPASVFPELGPRYTAIGMKELATNPHSTFQNLANNGLLPNRVIPWSFKTAGERLNMASNFWDMAEATTKGIAFNGAKQRALDMGMNPTQATMKAISDTKNMTYTTDPSRMARALMSEGPVSQVVTRLGGQFKGVPLKLISQYTDIASNFKNEPMKLARLVAGGGLAAGGTALGMHTFHMNPTSLLAPTVLGPFGNAMTQVGKDFIKGDVASAIGNTLAWAVPGGQQIKSVFFK